MKRLRAAISVWAASLMLVFAGICRAQTPAAPVPVTVENVQEAIDKAEEGFAQKAEEVRRLIEAEIAAKRVSEEVGARLRFSLQTATVRAASLDSRSVLSTATVPPENLELSRAMNELQVAHTLLQTSRLMIATEAIKDLRSRVAAMIRTASKEGEVEALASRAANLSDTLRLKFPSDYGTWANSFQATVTSLRLVNQILRAEASGRPELLSRAASEVQSSMNQLYDRDFLSTADLQARVDRAIAPLQAKTDAAQKALDVAILERKPEAELTAAHVRFQTAAGQLAEAKSGPYGRTNDTEDPRVAYRTIVTALSTFPPADLSSVHEYFSNARTAAQQLGGARAGVILQFFTDLETDATKSAEQAARERTEKLRLRLGTIKDAHELEALATEAAQWRTQRTRNGPDAEHWSSVATELAALAGAWRTANLDQLRDGQTSGDPRRNHLAPELQALRKRIELDVFTRTLRLPELQTPPFVDQPLDAAIESLCDQFVSKAEWRRLYQVLEARSRTSQGRFGPDETLTALRTFFAAQNLELAELWSEAAQAYRGVLQSASERAPVQAAAERLKVLTKDHPEVLTPPRGSLPGRDFQPRP